MVKGSLNDAKVYRLYRLHLSLIAQEEGVAL